VELEALEPPPGVDESVFSQLKAALREALVHGVGARHAVPLRENEALLERVGREFMPAEGAARLKSRSTESSATTDNRRLPAAAGLTARRIAAKAPPGPAGAVIDLSAQGVQAKTLVWHYRNAGDYSQDGIVNIMDITPLAVYFNRAVGTHPMVEVVDGNEDGFVTIVDVTPLAAGFFNQVSCYSVEGSDQAGSGYSEIGTVGLASATGEGRLLLSYELGLPEYRYYRVIARDDAGDAGDPSNTVYIEPLVPPQIVEVWPRSGLTGSEVEFMAVVTGTPPLTYLWDFAGAAIPGTSGLAQPAVTLGAPGEYAASLTVTNAVGEDAFEFALTVIDPADLPEVQSVSPTEGVAGEAVEFTAVVTGASPFSFSWHFGDGATPNDSTEESPEVTLGLEGSYDCRVKVENAYGEHTLFFTLVVHAP